MIEVELRIPDGGSTEAVVRAVERACLANDLTRTLKGTLASHRGSVHWHFKKGRQTGTLEITWWETGRHLWFKVAGNRASQRIQDMIPRLKEQIEGSFDKR
ncbi:MAG TPA: hypothetical protein VFO91_07130 [Anaerolineales bacterium]|nr:hypothetical protein [Anaerolineales bacterium]